MSSVHFQLIIATSRRIRKQGSTAFTPLLLAFGHDASQDPEPSSAALRSSLCCAVLGRFGAAPCLCCAVLQRGTPPARSQPWLHHFPFVPEGRRERHVISFSSLLGNLVCQAGSLDDGRAVSPLRTTCPAMALYTTLCHVVASPPPFRLATPPRRQGRR